MFFILHVPSLHLVCALTSFLPISSLRDNHMGKCVEPKISLAVLFRPKEDLLKRLKGDGGEVVQVVQP